MSHHGETKEKENNRPECLARDADIFELPGKTAARSQMSKDTRARARAAAATLSLFIFSRMERVLSVCHIGLY